MAHGGQGEVKISEDELTAIGKAFEDMGVKPSAASAKDFQKWLSGYGKGGAVSKGDKSSGSPGDGSGNTTVKEHPRLPIFSGEKKGDVDFDLWRFQVQCLLKENYKEEVIALTIRRSLRGEAARVVMRLGSQANITDILNKFESIYGTVDKKQILLSKFYSCRQDINEDVTSWGCRLEDLLSKVREISAIPNAEVEQMLKDMFWEGLRPSLKDATGHIYDKDLPFDELRKAIRIKEEDLRKRHDKNEHSNAVTTSSKSEIDELKEMIQNVNSEMKQMKEEMLANTMDDTDQFINSQQHFNMQGYGHYGHQNQQRGYIRNYGRRFYGRRQRGQGFGRGFIQQQQREQHQQDTSDYVHSTPKYTESGDPICMRCGQEGHIALGCRVRLDHQRKSLNLRGPTSRRGR